MTTPETATERTTVIVLHLAKGHKMTIRQVMEKANLGRSGAYALMARISCKAPLMLFNEEYSLIERNPQGVDSEGVG